LNSNTSGDEGHSKENGFKGNSADKNMFDPESSSKSFSVKDCPDKEDTRKSHHSSKRSTKETENGDGKSKHRHSSHGDSRKKHESRHSSSSKQDGSKSHQKSYREDKDRNSSSSKRHREDKSSEKIKKEQEDDDDIEFAATSKKIKISTSESNRKIKNERLSPDNLIIKKEKNRDDAVRVKRERSSPDLFSVTKEQFDEKPKIKKEDSNADVKPRVKYERASPEPKVKREKSEPKASVSKKSSPVKVKKELKRELDSEDSNDGINNNAGTSFADVLGNLDQSPSPLKKNKEKRKKVSPKSTSGFKPLPRSEVIVENIKVQQMK
jgi:hypothetical protein